MLHKLKFARQELARRYRLWRAIRWPWRVPSLETSGVSCQWLSLQPPILLAAHWLNEQHHTMYSLRPVFRQLGSRTAYFLYFWSWHIADDARVSTVARMEQSHRRRFPGHHFIHLCNSRQQHDAFQRHGLEAVLCNHNCMVDETLYRPIADMPKRFDAVHNARLKAYKRHELSSDISSLAVIYASTPGVDDPREAAAIRQRILHAHFFNHDSEGNYQPLDDAEVCRHLNECRVGLCLSAIEGGMFASIEYLLCGLPVVSTESLGGRDVFFDEDNALIVQATPEAVRAGVDAMLARNPAPEAVRQGALAVMLEQRRAFQDVVQSIYEREGIRRNFAEEFPRLFYNRLQRFQAHGGILRQLVDGAPTSPAGAPFPQA